MIAGVTSVASQLSSASAVSGLSRISFATSPPVAGSVTEASGISSFSDMLGQVANEAVQSIKAGESASIAGIEGKASVQQVVDTIMSAERSLQTAIAVRDKLVSAFQEITRMSI